MPTLPPCFFQKSFPSLWKASRLTYGGRTGRCATLPYNACDLIVSNSVLFCTLTVILFPTFLHFSPVSLIIFLCSFRNYFPSSPFCPHLMVRLVLTCIFVLCVYYVLGWWLWCSTSVCTYGSVGERGPTKSALFKWKLEEDFKRNFWKRGPRETNWKTLHKHPEETYTHESTGYCLCSLTFSSWSLKLQIL